jgi:deazaflavin-dependent oxidoreductase (nitroreductase family)
MGLGALMGSRFIHLVHIGRNSGLRRETVIEVVDHEPDGDVYYLVSAWGKRADWYLNIEKTPQVNAQVGRHNFIGRAELVSQDQAVEVILRYGCRHPRTLQMLARTMGYRIATDEESYRALGRELLMVAIHVEKELG